MAVTKKHGQVYYYQVYRHPELGAGRSKKHTVKTEHPPEPEPIQEATDLDATWADIQTES